MAYTLYMFISLKCKSAKYLIYASTIQLNITAVNTLNLFFLFIYIIYIPALYVFNIIYRFIIYCIGYI
nr:MAG TPA: hypothetical protein [Bacteriophage sp.]